MKIQRDCTLKGRSKPRISNQDKEELKIILQRLTFLVGKQIDRKAHTVQIVFTGEQNETVIIFQ